MAKKVKKKTPAKKEKKVDLATIAEKKAILAAYFADLQEVARSMLDEGIDLESPFVATLSALQELENRHDEVDGFGHKIEGFKIICGCDDQEHETAQQIAHSH
jgi:hypothetical protein